MKTSSFGSTDIQVTNLCLGTMQFGWTADEAASVSVLDGYVEAGGNFIDTADMYSRWVPGNPGGVSEEIIGRWMKERGNRAGLVIATKLRGQMWDGADGEGLGRAHVERAVEDSLRRLQVETIDLYQTHWPDDGTPLEETLTVFGELVKSRKVRHIGFSNSPTDNMIEALRLAEAKGLPRIVSLQPHHNLVWRKEYEARKAAFCVENGIAVIPYSPLEGGFLTGKYRRGEPLPNSQRAGGVKRFLTDDGYDVVDALTEIASAKGVTTAAVALAWSLTRPAIVAPIIGANNTEQLADLLPAGDLELTADEVSALDAASAWAAN